MIANESATEELTMVSRMLSYQLEQDSSISRTFSVLRERLPEQHERSIQVLEKMIAGDGEVHIVGYGPNAFGLLNEFGKIVKEEGKDISQLFACSQGIMRDAVVQAREYWSGFNSLISYFVLVLFFAVIVSGIFSYFVFPQFQLMFDQFGAGLPAITKLVISDGIFFPVIILFLAVIVLLCVMCSYHIRVRVAQFRPLAAWLRWIPGINRLNNAYNYFLFVQYATILCKSGVSQQSSINHAERFANIYKTDTKNFKLWRAAINFSGKIDVLLSELDYQCLQVGTLFGRYMIIVRERLTLVVQVVLGLMVGILITAMYLPIFMMGEVV